MWNITFVLVTCGFLMTLIPVATAAQGEPSSDGHLPNEAPTSATTGS